MGEGRQFDSALGRVLLLPARCLFPLLALAVIVGTLFWGPWVSLALALVSWRIVGRFS